MDRKQAELQSAIQTRTAFLILQTITQNQWSKHKLMNQQNFLACPTYDSDNRKLVESTQQIHKDLDDVFNAIGCFEGTFSL